MKKVVCLKAIVGIVLCLAVVCSLASCSGLSGGNIAGTMADCEIGKNDEVEFLKLSDIYFPSGMLETGLGLYIWDNVKKTWVRTDTEEGKALFRNDKSIVCFTHGMGGNGSLDCPDYYYDEGYNPLTFMWGAMSDEAGETWTLIADKVWYRQYGHWRKTDNSFEENDLSNAACAEIYGAYYYDLLSAFPDYSGSEIVLMGHSYGGMLTGAMLSFLCSMYNKGHLPAYMLPDKVNFLDPYFSRADYNAELIVPWLLPEERPLKGNVNEAIYQAALESRNLGIAIGLVRTSKPVCTPTTLNAFGLDVTGSYWNFCNSIVYAHISDNWKTQFPNFLYENLHGYGWSWFDEYNTGYILKDTSATVDEEAYCFYMPYEKMFAKAGIKYDFDINGTKEDIEDDIVTSFFCTYVSGTSVVDKDPINDAYYNESKTLLDAYTKGKAKIAGFAYLDRNGNGVMDERLKDHFYGAKVTVKDADGNVIYTTITSANGYYEVETDVAGEYTVTFSVPKKYSVATEEVKVNIVDTERQVAINNVCVSQK